MNNDIQIFTETVRYDDDQLHVFIKPLCDLFGLDSDNQRNTVLRDSILNNESVTKADEFIFGDKRERLALTKIGFVRWVQLLNPELVRPELKDKLIQYQRDITEWIFGNINAEMRFRSNYKRSAEITSQIKALQAEKKSCDAYVNSYLISKAYQTALPFDTKALN